MEFNATFLVTIISFLVFVFLMNKILYLPMQKIVSERQKFIDNNLNLADENYKKAETLCVNRENKLEEAKNEAKSQYLDSVNDFKAEKSEIVSKAQAETNNELEKTFADLNHLSDITKDELKNRMTDLANDIVEKVLGYKSDVKGFNEDDVNKILWY